MSPSPEKTTLKSVLEKFTPKKTPESAAGSAEYRRKLTARILAEMPELAQQEFDSGLTHLVVRPLQSFLAYDLQNAVKQTESDGEEASEEQLRDSIPPEATDQLLRQVREAITEAIRQSAQSSTTDSI